MVKTTSKLSENEKIVAGAINESEYCKKLAAENQCSKALLVPWGFPNNATKSSSELIDTTEPTGPF